MINKDIASITSSPNISDSPILTPNLPRAKLSNKKLFALIICSLIFIIGIIGALLYTQKMYNIKNLPTQPSISKQIPLTITDLQSACTQLTQNSWITQFTGGNGFAGERTEWKFLSNGSFEYLFTSDYQDKISGLWIIKPVDNSTFELITFAEPQVNSSSAISKRQVSFTNDGILLSGSPLKKGTQQTRSSTQCGLNQNQADKLENHYKKLFNNWSNQSYHLTLGNKLIMSGVENKLTFEGNWLIEPSSENGGTLKFAGWLEYDNPFPQNPTYRDRRNGSLIYSYQIDTDKLVIKLISYSMNPNIKSVLETQKQGIELVESK